MLSNLSRLEHKIGDKIYHFLCDSDSPLEHVREALIAYLDYVNKVEESHKAILEQARLAKEKEEADKAAALPVEVPPSPEA